MSSDHGRKASGHRCCVSAVEQGLQTAGGLRLCTLLHDRVAYLSVLLGRLESSIRDLKAEHTGGDPAPLVEGLVEGSLGKRLTCFSQSEVRRGFFV